MTPPGVVAGVAMQLLRMARGYATHHRAGSRLNGALNLEQFIQRGRVLAFYRTIVRGTRRIPDAKTRAESRKYARDEFERHRGVKDAPAPLHGRM
ncbi:hypothetical protein B0I35DRAFT_478438 [Stachybotrys elegans]|uniref:Complex 1 LYR protein domain-containing protein n=1 Tax=Stachybotrys elegans TaxID=80388 RepID=A0A8K0WS36_9HYPO|nr:hypothetical protein B0I35DRAFT_478438 [Stachybotrys elegans]